MIKAIILDFGGVYFNDGYHVFMSKLAKKHSIPRERIVKVILDDFVYGTGFVIGKTGEGEALTGAFKKLGIKEDWRKYHKIILKWYTPRKKFIDFVKELRKDFRICMLSDQTDYIMELEEKYRFFKDFDLSIISTQVGVAKPDERIFNLALNIMKIKPREAVFVDDNPINVKSAEKIGINSFTIKDFEKNDFSKFRKLVLL